MRGSVSGEKDMRLKVDERRQWLRLRFRFRSRNMSPCSGSWDSLPLLPRQEIHDGDFVVHF